jgi:hypothetical protein
MGKRRREVSLVRTERGRTRRDQRSQRPRRCQPQPRSREVSKKAQRQFRIEQQLRRFNEILAEEKLFAYGYGPPVPMSSSRTASRRGSRTRVRAVRHLKMLESYYPAVAKARSADGTAKSCSTVSRWGSVESEVEDWFASRRSTGAPCGAVEEAVRAQTGVTGVGSEVSASRVSDATGNCSTAAVCELARRRGASEPSPL